MLKKLVIAVTPLRDRIRLNKLIAFEKRNGIDISTPIYQDQLEPSSQRSHPYEISPCDRRFVGLLKCLPITKHDGVLDYGCGKGGPLIEFSKFPFGKVGGLDLSPKLCAIATANMNKMGIPAQIICKDAAEFTDLDDFNYFYFFNPFPAVVMDQVVENILESANRTKRQVVLIYFTPRQTEAAKKHLHLVMSMMSGRTGHNIYEVYSSNPKISLNKDLYLSLLEKLRLISMNMGGNYDK